MSVQPPPRRNQLVLTEPRPVTPNRTTWPVGLRVSRKDTTELGTVVERNGGVKVKWDGGRTSVFRRGQEANVQLQPIEA